jgi:two-component system, chemotaxis family, protein-glutamate methylesterase/glutaminase
MMVEKAKIKVLVVDDSRVSQKLYQYLISNDPRFELICMAGNGKEAIDCVTNLHPDIVSMDIEMPGMDGVEATRNIMQLCPVPILIVSGLYQPQEITMAMEVLNAGAVGIIPKPHGPGHPKFEKDARNYLQMLSLMSEIKVVTRKNKHLDTNPFNVSRTERPNWKVAELNAENYRIIVIGASAGGPEVVKTILTGLRPDLSVPVLIVQHIDPHFAAGYCDWLATSSVLPVRLVLREEDLLPGHVYLPPGGKHLMVPSAGKVCVSDEPPIQGYRPSVGGLFRSAARAYQEKMVAVILSGMGKDGASEMKMLRDLGAYTIAQDEQSCLVFGMPGEAIKLGGAIQVLSPAAILSELNKLNINKLNINKLNINKQAL